MPFNEQQRSDDLLSPAACLSLSQLFVLYEHLFNDALAVGTDFPVSYTHLTLPTKLEV